MADDAGLRRQQSISAQHYLTNVVTDTALQETVRLTARLLDFPIVQVNVLDDLVQHTVASVGGAQESIPRADSLCDHVVRSGRILTLAELDHIPPQAAHIRTYAGVPITGREGLVIGSLCIADTVTRVITPEQLADLAAAAAVVQDQLELLRRLRTASVGSIAETATLVVALESGHIVPHYQPVVDIATGEVQAVEALARWEDPVRGLIEPKDFVPLAEDSEIIVDLDLTVLAAAVADLAAWRRANPGLGLHVNLSARHFDHPDCVERLSSIVRRSAVPPSDVTFEVTETAALTTHVIDARFLPDLRDAGFKIFLDDFGTGFSSMTRVLRLPVDGIKLDPTLTSAMGTPAGDAVSRALLGMATDLGLSTVIEGWKPRSRRPERSPRVVVGVRATCGPGRSRVRSCRRGWAGWSRAGRSAWAEPRRTGPPDRGPPDRGTGGDMELRSRPAARTGGSGRGQQ